VCVCLYIYTHTYTHTVVITTILQVVAIYNIQLHVSALYVGYHEVFLQTMKFAIDVTSHYTMFILPNLHVRIIRSSQLL